IAFFLVEDPNKVPSPMEVFYSLKKIIKEGVMFSAIENTLFRMLSGYAMGMLFGIPLGVLCARIRVFRDSLGLLALGLQALPSVCWAIPAILWFGSNNSAMIFVVLMGSMWSMLLSTQHGVMNISPIYIRAARTMGSKGLHSWAHVIIPAAFPNIVGGMKQGWAFAWRSLMAAEIVVPLPLSKANGLGLQLNNARNDTNIALIIGIMIVIVLIGLLVDKILFSPWEKMLRKRWGLDVK
ncbi:MAG: ABC transporter permease subunit, partial [Opitutales bacterium]|nr:ABC transporter permease subunit [Opitutales bacterium]